MRIGIDATAIPPRRVGAGNYIFNLVGSLAKVDFKNEYFVFAKPEHVDEWGCLRENFHLFASASNSRTLRIVWEQSVLPLRLRKHRIDVLHSPHYTMPLASACRSVVTFCDLIFFLYPEMHTPLKRVFFQSMMRLSAKRSTRITAISQSAASDLQSVLGVPRSKIHAIPLGVASHFRPLDDATGFSRVCGQYALDRGKFILYIGTLEPRKNIVTLLRAYHLLVAKGLRQPLVIVGRKGWMYADIFRTVASFGLEKQVVFTGYVPEGDLPYLYNAARVFVYPSIYEGFGLPVLEAMACGTPVVTSNVSSMPEVAGDAALLIEPRDHEQMASAMESVLADETLRQSLRERGLKRAGRYTWENTARETVKVYELACDPLLGNTSMHN